VRINELSHRAFGFDPYLYGGFGKISSGIRDCGARARDTAAVFITISKGLRLADKVPRAAATPL
jgi:hypothetical protein